MKAIVLFLALLCFSVPAQAEILSFDWMLSETPDAIPKADVIDLDLFDADAKLVAKLNTAGKKTVCYINVGAWEEWRSDKDAFPPAVLGKDYEGWAGEKWLDIRAHDVIEPLMKARLDLCKAKGFWGVEPDNMNLHEQDTGFGITTAAQVDYALWLAKEAHARGLTIGIKNAPDLLPELMAAFDWALLEDCFAQSWCAQFAPMAKARKPVFIVEYTDNRVDMKALCSEAQSLGMSAIVKKRELGVWGKQCEN